MKVEEYACNLCGETLANLEELVGLNMDSKSKLCISHVENAKYHLCSCCVIEMGVFAEKWRRIDTMSPTEKHAWGLVW